MGLIFDQRHQNVVLDSFQNLWAFGLINLVQCDRSLIPTSNQTILSCGSRNTTCESCMPESLLRITFRRPKTCIDETPTVSPSKNLTGVLLVCKYWPCFYFVRIFFAFLAKQVMELVGSSQSTFGDMVSELGLSAAMRPEAEYTLLAPLNTAFNGERHTAQSDVSVGRIL